MDAEGGNFYGEVNQIDAEKRKKYVVKSRMDAQEWKTIMLLKVKLCLKLIKIMLNKVNWIVAGLQPVKSWSVWELAAAVLGPTAGEADKQTDIT